MLAVTVDDIKHTSLSFKAVEPAHVYIHPVNCNEVIMDGKTVGTMGIVHPSVGKKIDKKASIVFAELDVEALAHSENLSISYEEPSKFPPMDYDLSLEIPQGVFFDKLRECWKNAGEILRNTRIVDTYDSETVHSITVRFEFSSNERTLSSDEVQTIMDGIIGRLADIGVKLR